MNIQIIGTSAYAPFLFLENGLVLSYKSGKIYLMDENLVKKDKPIELFSDFKHRFLSKIQILSRLFRIGIRTAIQVNSNCILIQAGHRIIEFDPFKRTFSEGYFIGRRIRALNITRIESIKGFDDMAVFGEYLFNPLRKKVSIFKRDEVDKWSVAYTFPEGMINHIHNIIPDSYHDCVWVLTGDFGHAACIWKATDNFRKVIPVLQNNQLYRSCVAFPTPQGVIYATDAPFAPNYICLLYKENDIFKIKRICEIAGSCIYGTKVQDYIFFSTTVEGDGRDSSLFKLFLDRKRGEGIKDNKSHLYVGSVDNGFQDVYQAKKDFLPFAFQFGMIHFPQGMKNLNIIYANHIATKYHSCSMKIQIK